MNRISAQVQVDQNTTTTAGDHKLPAALKETSKRQSEQMAKLKRLQDKHARLAKAAQAALSEKTAAMAALRKASSAAQDAAMRLRLDERRAEEAKERHRRAGLETSKAQ